MVSSVELEEALERKSGDPLPPVVDPQDKQTGQNQRPCFWCGWSFLRYFFRHPWFRTFCCTFIAALNVLIYAEDPIAHSKTEANIPIIGNSLSLLFHNYPTASVSESLRASKIVVAILFIFIGCFIGRQFVHNYLLRDTFKVKMFDESKGSWMIMFWTTLLTLYLGALFYNELVYSELPDSQHTEYEISGNLGITNEEFMKIAASGTWMGDYITAYMVIDMMLQDTEYPGWAPSTRASYRKGNFRVVAFWFITVTLSCIVITAIAIDYINWDDYGEDFDFSTNELGRGFLASVITSLDLFIILQDWEFPTFTTNQEVNLPGLFTYQIKINPPEWLDWFSVHITGKWFNYGIIFMVMLLDLNMLKNQVAYRPWDFGQYTDPDGFIYTITDGEALRAFNADPQPGNPQYWWNIRRGVGDQKTQAKFLGFSNVSLGLTLLPAACTLLLFFVLFKLENPGRSTHEKPHGHSRAESSAHSVRRVEPNGSDSNQERVETTVGGWGTPGYSQDLAGQKNASSAGAREREFSEDDHI